LDEFPMPVFIVAKNNLNIFYKNQSSDTLLKNAHAHRSPVKKQTITLSKMKKKQLNKIKAYSIQKQKK